MVCIIVYMVVISPACGIELVEVVGSGRIGVDLLVEVFLPGRRGERQRRERRGKEGEREGR